MKQEQELVRLAQTGDQAAFGELVERYQKQVFNLALRMVCQEQDALDLSQEAFVRAWRGLPGFRADAQFSTWLYRLTSNICIDFLRAQKNRRTVSMTVEDDAEPQQWQVPDPAPGPEEVVMEREQARKVQAAMAQLTVQQRQILVLRSVHGMSYGEIGDIMDLKEGTVKSRLARTREQLRKILYPEGNQTPSGASNRTEGGDT